MKLKLYLLAFLLACVPAFAEDRITATLTVTNAAGTTNGQTIQIVASDTTTRTWTNSVSIPASQVLTNSSAEGSTTNLYAQLVSTSPLGVAPILMTSSTNIVLYGQAGVVLQATLSAGWGTVTYSTQAVTAALTVRVPYTVEASAQRTNVSSELVNWLNLTANTNQIAQTSTAAAQLAGLTNAQTISGVKQFTGANTHTSPILISPTLTNGINYENAFSSPGIGGNSEQFGKDASATNTYSTAVGNQAHAWGASSVAIGVDAEATGTWATSLGSGAQATNTASVALGNGAASYGENSTAVGTAATALHRNSTAIGYFSATTDTNQIMLGGSGINAVVQNSLTVLSGATIANGVTNLIATGTNSFSDIAFRRYAITSLANGNNAGIVVGTNTFVEVSGPSAAFAINGMTGSPSRDGHLVVVVNQTGFDMTIAHQSGVDATAANRIITMTGADRATTGNGAATFIYSASASRWLLISFDP